MSNYEKMTMVELKEELKKRGLPVSGIKKLLIERLTESDAGSDNEGKAPTKKADDNSLSKLKVAELKEKLKERGLSVSGNKSDLLERLQASMDGKPVQGATKAARKASTGAEERPAKRRKVEEEEEEEVDEDEEDDEEDEDVDEDEDKDDDEDDEDEGAEGEGDTENTNEPEHKSDELKIVTWNVASFSSILKKGFESYLKSENPDILCLNETKIHESKVPMNKFPGYYSYFSSCTYNAGYSGVGVITKIKPISVTKGIGIAEHDTEGRCITAEYDNFYLVATYIPNAGQPAKSGSGKGWPQNLDKRMNWDKDFQDYLNQLVKTKPVVWCGDLNVAHNPIDLKNPTKSTKLAGFTQKERDSFGNFLATGWLDTYRQLHPTEKDCYTFWSYRAKGARENNTGWRLDYFVVSQNLMDRVTQSEIRKNVMGSDHCPIVLHLKK